MTEGAKLNVALLLLLIYRLLWDCLGERSFHHGHRYRSLPLEREKKRAWVCGGGGWREYGKLDPSSHLATNFPNSKRVCGENRNAVRVQLLRLYMFDPHDNSWIDQIPPAPSYHTYSVVFSSFPVSISATYAAYV